MHDIAFKVKRPIEVASLEEPGANKASLLHPPHSEALPAQRTRLCISFQSKQLSIYSISRTTLVLFSFLNESLQQTGTTACLGYSL